MDIRDLLSKATAATEFMYDKTATVMRYVEYTKPSGADGQRWEDVHVSVPCRLSSVKLDNTSQADANLVQYDTKLFLSSGSLILAGDRLSVDGVMYESAKEPFVYVTHQEVLLVRKDWA